MVPLVAEEQGTLVLVSPHALYPPPPAVRECELGWEQAVVRVLYMHIFIDWLRPGAVVQSAVKLILCECHPQTSPI